MGPTKKPYVPAFKKLRRLCECKKKNTKATGNVSDPKRLLSHQGTELSESGTKMVNNALESLKFSETA